MNRRTTVNADSQSLEILEDEARRRGSSLSTVLAEAVSEKATAIVRDRKPRLGVGRSTDGSSAAETATHPIARPPS
jgi:hypothetical protein